jgi:hypothetical protein
VRTDVSGISHWRSLATADNHANRKVAANIISISVIRYNINYDHNVLHYHMCHNISSVFLFLVVNLNCARIFLIFFGAHSFSSQLLLLEASSVS